MEERKGGMEGGKGGALWLDRVSQTSLHPLQSSSRLGQDPFGDWGAEESLTDPLSLSFSLGQWGRKSCDLRGCLRALKAGSRMDTGRSPPTAGSQALQAGRHGLCCGRMGTCPADEAVLGQGRSEAAWVETRPRPQAPPWSSV